MTGTAASPLASPSSYVAELSVADVRRVIFASSLGTVFEWYDFYLYGSLAAIISKQFFSGVNPTAAFILAWETSGGPVRAHAGSTRRSHRAEISTIRSDWGSRNVSNCGGFVQPAQGERAGGCRGRPHRFGSVDGILGMELHGRKDLLEPRPVVGSDGGWIVVRRIERIQ